MINDIYIDDIRIGIIYQQATVEGHILTRHGPIAKGVSPDHSEHEPPPPTPSPPAPPQTHAQNHSKLCNNPQVRGGNQQNNTHRKLVHFIGEADLY